MTLSLSKLRTDFKSIYKKNPDTSLRLSALIELTKIELNHRNIYPRASKRLQILSLCQGIDISERTLYRWRRAYESGGIFALTRKRAKGRVAQELSLKARNHILDMRTKYRWGSEVIQAHLKHDYGIELTRHKIERYLKTSGLQERYPCTTKKVKRKEKRKHDKKVVVHNPGEHTQIDTKHQPHVLKNKKKCYVFNFIDHASNWSYKRAYASLSPRSTQDFMRRLLKECPFRINRIQSDNGTEYTYRFYKRYMDVEKKHPFEEFCKRHDIVHKLIPPGEKELQGLVERSHRQDDQELFMRVEPFELEEFNKLLHEHCHWRNSSRRFKKLGWLSPNEWLENYLVVSMSLALPSSKNTSLPKSTNGKKTSKDMDELTSCKERRKKDDNMISKKAA
jgi:transposase InsO family protein